MDGKQKCHKTVIDKVILLTSIYDCSLKLVYDRRFRTQERHYWLSDEKHNQMQNAWNETHEKHLAEINKALAAARVSYDLTMIEKADFSRVVSDMFDDNSDNILLLQNEKAGLRHPIFQELSALPFSVFLLTEQKWAKIPNIIGAVDPLHENSRPFDIDGKIVNQIKKLAKKLSANWTIAHACFIQPMFLGYKAQFEDIHREGLYRFTNALGIKKENTALLKGMPEEALANWIKNNKGDLLVLGIIARNKLMAHLVGSTTIALLYEPPCDMLLLKSHSHLD